MYKDTVTVFNRYGGSWRGVVLNGVDLNADRAMVVQRYGEHATDRALLHIKYESKNNGYYIGSLLYVEPNSYAGDGITFQEGNNMSFFMEGVAPIMTADDDDYTDGFLDFMNANYNVYVISSVARYSVIPHFEITGR